MNIRVSADAKRNQNARFKVIPKARRSTEAHLMRRSLTAKAGGPQRRSFLLEVQLISLRTILPRCPAQAGTVGPISCPGDFVSTDTSSGAACLPPLATALDRPCPRRRYRKPAAPLSAHSFLVKQDLGSDKSPAASHCARVCS